MTRGCERSRIEYNVSIPCGASANFREHDARLRADLFNGIYVEVAESGSSISGSVV